ncbi:MAG: hypothetical protein UY41_C0016G0005 [Candidatus Moranbacteria bacterium GW2011_GWE1_49_15]|nr:MAG: hypothetical protein UX75_C0023G0003 [Candidatus Moranbacteria bacterium GW2011_GWE2_47_10]KKW06735.1 MAG: hypothetical protein UY41_C0016G0005 [Candidatus Moranbacteria bacterium GW2011_GWE1_49_15]HBP00777.1 hypothetical protein [Candidatus Moranbacteria bacterium]
MAWFARKRKDEIDEALPEKPSMLAPHVGVVSLGAYETLAAEVGFYPLQLFKEQLMRFLAEEKIPNYDYGQVDKYMTHMAEKEGKIWIWRPLRAKDGKLGSENLMGHTKKNEPDWRGHGSFYNGYPGYSQYDKFVPPHILRLVKKISERFPKLAFFVSDYAVPNPDPFIMMMTEGIDPIVFGVWDEPTFEEKEAEE